MYKQTIYNNAIVPIKRLSKITIDNLFLFSNYWERFKESTTLDWQLFSYHLSYQIQLVLRKKKKVAIKIPSCYSGGKLYS